MNPTIATVARSFRRDDGEVRLDVGGALILEAGEGDGEAVFVGNLSGYTDLRHRGAGGEI